MRGILHYAFCAMLAGDVEEAQRRLCELLGANDCGARIRYNSETSRVTVNLAGIDTSKNEGALLLGQLVDSPKVYNLTLGNAYLTAAGWKSLGREAIVNNSNTFDPPRFSFEKPASVRPPEGVDSLVAIDPATARYRDSEGRRVTLSSVIFHELAEAYSKVDLGKPYINFELGTLEKGRVVQTPTAFQRGAHNDAVEREIILRVQRPELQATGRAGDMLTRDSNPE